MRAPLQVFLLSAAVYSLFAYGGVRAPDSEIAFRTAEALAFEGRLAVDHPLENWREFAGLRTGRDGQLYSVFGPAEPYALSLALPLAARINRTGWYEPIRDRIPISHYEGEGVLALLRKGRPADIGPHALRLLMSPFNVLISALAAMAFFVLARTLNKRETGAWYATLFFALGSLAFPYSGTFFTEPMATLFMLSSLCLLARNDVGHEVEVANQRKGLFAAGLLGMLAVASHITAALMAPFLVAYALAPALGKGQGEASNVKRGALDLAFFLAGMSLVAALMGVYNHVRFGSVLETGRTTGAQHFGVTAVWPWHGLHYLLTGGGKGLLWFCPAVLIGLFAWPSFHRRHRVLSYALMAAVALRVLFLSSYFWKCGFCLGPRYLLLSVPLLLLPTATWVDSLVEARRYRALAAVACALSLCIAEQLSFAIGEPYLYLHVLRAAAHDRHYNIFHNDELFVSWAYSPLFRLLNGARGPFLLQAVPLSNQALWGLCAGLGALAVGVWHVRNQKRWRRGDA